MLVFRQDPFTFCLLIEIILVTECDLSDKSLWTLLKLPFEVNVWWDFVTVLQSLDELIIYLFSIGVNV